MNHPSKQLKDMTFTLFKARSGVIRVNRLKPGRDWLVGTFVATCITVSIAAWSGYTYVANRDGGTTQEKIEVANPSYQTTLIDQALDVFVERETSFNAVSLPVITSPEEQMLDIDPRTGTSTATTSRATEAGAEAESVTPTAEATTEVSSETDQSAEVSELLQ